MQIGISVARKTKFPEEKKTNRRVTGIGRRERERKQNYFYDRKKSVDLRGGSSRGFVVVVICGDMFIIDAQDFNFPALLYFVLENSETERRKQNISANDFISFN